MHIGGVHIIGGVAYLVLITLLVFGYFLVFYWISHFFRWLWRELHTDIREAVKPEVFFKGLGKKTLRLFIFVFCAIAAFNIAFYINQRSDWMGDDNAHYKAKEYYVAGQVLYLYRSFLTKFIHPDIFILSPLSFLQDSIYKTGIKYLPDNDGEIGVWTDQWLVYPYSKKSRLPWNYTKYVNKHQKAPKLIELLDRSWFAIESMATKPFADRQMYEQHYLRNFPGMVFYYSLNDGFYIGNITGSLFKLSTIPEFIQRSENILIWLEELKSNWQKSERTLAFLKEEPRVEALRQAAFAINAKFILISRIDTGRFVCDDPYWKMFKEVRRDYSHGESGVPAVARMRDRETAERLKYIIADGEGSKFDWWVLHHYCDMDIGGDINWEDEIRGSENVKKPFEEFLVNRFFNYQKQLDLLEEQFNGTR